MLAATIVTAVATAMLVLGAGFTVYYAKQAFDKQSAALSKLTTQVDDQVQTNAKLREAADKQVAEINASLARLQEENDARRRAQAAKVFVWITRVSAASAVGWSATTDPPVPRTIAHVRNASDRPVYQLELTWKIGTSTRPPPDKIPTLLPGDETTGERDTHPGVVYDPFGPDLQFTDADGVRWLLTLGGSLSEVEAPVQSGAATPAV